MGNIPLIGNTLLIRYILLLSSILVQKYQRGCSSEGLTAIEGPGRTLCKIVYFCWGYIFSEYGKNRKNSINQPNATSGNLHSVMHGVSHGDQHDVVHGVGN